MRSQRHSEGTCSCGHAIRERIELVGSKVRCPRCQAAVLLLDPDAPLPAALSDSARDEPARFEDRDLYFESEFAFIGNVLQYLSALWCGIWIVLLYLVIVGNSWLPETPLGRWLTIALLILVVIGLPLFVFGFFFYLGLALAGLRNWARVIFGVFATLGATNALVFCVLGNLAAPAFLCVNVMLMWLTFSARGRRVTQSDYRRLRERDSNRRRKPIPICGIIYLIAIIASIISGFYSSAQWT